MVYLLVLVPATALTIAGYFVLFLSARTEGALRTFGRYLGFWAFTLAGLLILAALFAAARGFGGHGARWCPGPYEGWHGANQGWHGCMHDGADGADQGLHGDMRDETTPQEHAAEQPNEGSSPKH